MRNKRREFLVKSGALLAGSTIATMTGASLGHISVISQDIKDIRSEDIDGIKILLENKKPNIWLFTGDSITHGALHTHGCRSYPEVFEERIRWELRRMRDVIINTGISGNAASDILDDFKWRIRQFNPQVVSIMIGTNDCARKGMTPDIFKKNVAELISEIRAIGAVPVLHTPNVIIVDESPERRTLPDYIPKLRDLAKEEKVILIDNYQYWEDQIECKSKKELFKSWLDDRLHPNHIGHQEIARLMFRKLGIFDPAAATCGG